jgi:hypothetical protein
LPGLIAAREWGPLNCIKFDHPELQDTKDKVHSINDIYAKQVRNGLEITDLTMLNNGATWQYMDMFLDHKVQANTLGEFTTVDKKEKRRQAGLVKKAGGAQISAGIMVVTKGYAIGLDCLP